MLENIVSDREIIQILSEDCRECIDRPIQFMNTKEWGYVCLLKEIHDSTGLNLQGIYTSVPVLQEAGLAIELGKDDIDVFKRQYAEEYNLPPQTFSRPTLTMLLPKGAIALLVGKNSKKDDFLALRNFLVRKNIITSDILKAIGSVSDAIDLWVGTEPHAQRENTSPPAQNNHQIVEIQTKAKKPESTPPLPRQNGQAPKSIALAPPPIRQVEPTPETVQCDASIHFEGSRRYTIVAAYCEETGEAAVLFIPFVFGGINLAEGVAVELAFLEFPTAKTIYNDNRVVCAQIERARPDSPKNPKNKPYIREGDFGTVNSKDPEFLHIYHVLQCVEDPNSLLKVEWRPREKNTIADSLSKKSPTPDLTGRYKVIVDRSNPSNPIVTGMARSGELRSHHNWQSVSPSSASRDPSQNLERAIEDRRAMLAQIQEKIEGYRQLLEDLNRQTQPIESELAKLEDAYNVLTGGAVGAA